LFELSFVVYIDTFIKYKKLLISLSEVCFFKNFLVLIFILLYLYTMTRSHVDKHLSPSVNATFKQFCAFMAHIDSFT